MSTSDVVNIESLTESVPTAETTQIAAAATDLNPPPIDVDKKKKRGSFGIFKAAMVMLRAKPKDKEKKKSIAKQNSTVSNASWTKLVGSMRPLHMQEVAESPPPSIAPDSPASTSSSSVYTMSQYASASSLRDLYNSSDDEEEEDPDEVFDAICGDEMIDAKAEEFIAQFYKQIRIQNHHRVHNHRPN